MVRLCPVTFDGDATSWVLLRRLGLASRLLVASMAGSLAGGRDGAFLTLYLVVRCSSTSGAEIEFWFLGPSVGLHFPLLSGGWKPLGLPRIFEVMDPVFFLPLLVAPSLEAPQRVPARFCG